MATPPAVAIPLVVLLLRAIPPIPAVYPSILSLGIDMSGAAPLPERLCALVRAVVGILTTASPLVVMIGSIGCCWLLVAVAVVFRLLLAAASCCFMAALARWISWSSDSEGGSGGYRLNSSSLSTCW